MDIHDTADFGLRGVLRILGVHSPLYSFDLLVVDAVVRSFLGNVDVMRMTFL